MLFKLVSDIYYVMNYIYFRFRVAVVVYNRSR
jgi:hypothetical protein